MELYKNWNVNEFKNTDGSWSTRRFEQHRKELLKLVDNQASARPTTRLVPLLRAIIEHHFDALDEPHMLCQDPTYVLNHLIEEAYTRYGYKWS